MWRATRFGMDGKLIDLERVSEVSAAAELERILSWTAPFRAEQRMEPAFPELNGAQRQRAAADAGEDLRTIYTRVVDETRRTYAPSEVSAP